MKKLHVLAFALAAGIIWAVGAFCLALLSLYWDIATPIVELIASGYKGYAATWSGGLFGALWGFADAFIGCAIFAWLYNVLAKKLK